MITYPLYLEAGPRRRKTMVHVLDLLGCVAVGHPAVILLGVPLSAIAPGSNQSRATALLGDFTAGERRGRALGWMHTFGDLSSAIAPPLAYWILPWIGLPGIYLACAGLLAGMWMWAVQLAQVRLSPKTISL